MEPVIRCPWAEKHLLLRQYHDTEWGVPCHDERQLFTMLNLEGMQAGLSWRGILGKRSTICAAFEGFDPHRIAAYTECDVARLLEDPGIIRCRSKVKAVIHNARAYLRLCEEYGSLDAFLRKFAGDQPIVGHWVLQKQVPTSTPLSEAISEEMKRRGFMYVGPKILYSYLQAVGIVNDHLATCAFRHGNGKPEEM